MKFIKLQPVWHRSPSSVKQTLAFLPNRGVMRGTGHFEWTINAMDPWTDEWDGLSCYHDSALFLQTESHHKACRREAKAIRHACITTDGSSDWLRSFCMCSSIEFYT